MTVLVASGQRRACRASATFGCAKRHRLTLNWARTRIVPCLLAAMFFELLPADPSLAFMLGTLTGVGFFDVAYGPSFAASRANVAEQQHAGTWQLT